MTIEQAVAVGGTDKALRTFEQTTAAGVVQSEAVVLVNPDDPSLLPGINTPLKTADSTDTEWASVATTVTAIGDTTIYTPAAGMRVRLHWVYAINDPVASSSTKITVKMGPNTYYVAWALSKRQQFTGPVDGPLIINLSATGTVAVTAFVEEV